MNDLIINGIDHSKFDLEWAKRGGVVLIIMDDSQLKILANLAKYVGEWAYFINTTRYAIPDCEVYFTCGLSGSSDLEMSSDTHYVERMATPSECAEAGIEYIEPPARWLPIESAPKDGTKVVLLAPTDDMLSPCEFVGEAVISETGAWLWWQFGPEWFTEVKNPTHYTILPKLPEETK